MSTTSAQLDPAETPSLHALAPEPADVDPRGVRHSPAVRELAFVCWVEANGNAEKARRALVETCRRDPSGILPRDDASCPSANAIRRWSQRDGWEAQFVEAVSGSYRHLLELYTARLIRMGGQALDTIDAMSAPDYVPQKGDFVRADLAKSIIQLLVLGTAGNRDGQPPLMSPKPAPTIDISSMTPDELSAYQRQQILDDQIGSHQPR